MGLIKKENQFRFVGIADLRQPFKQLGEQPEKKCRIKLRRINHFVRRKNIDHASSIAISLHHVVKVQGWLAKKLIRPLPFEFQQPALDGANARLGNIAVLSLELSRVIADVLQQGTKIFEIEQQQAVVVGNLEDQSQHTALGLV